MKKYLFLTVFGLMFVPSLVSSATIDVNQLWKTLVGLLQQENQLLKNEIVYLKEMNERLSEANLCPTAPVASNKDALYQADLAEINKAKTDKVAEINEAKRKECVYPSHYGACSANFDREIGIVLDKWEQQKADLSVKYYSN